MPVNEPVAGSSGPAEFMLRAGLVSPRAAALTEGVLRTMRLTKTRIAVTVLLLAGVGGASLVYPGPPGEATAVRAAGTDDDRYLVDVPSQREGVLLVLGTEVKDGEKVPAGRLVTIKVGEEEKKYRRLRVGDAVEEGQLLARVDDQAARDALAIKVQEVEAARADQKASLKTRDEAEQRYRTLERLNNAAAPGVRSMEDLRGAKLTFDRFFFEEISKREAIKKAEAEVTAAEHCVKKYEVRSPASGTITKIYKSRGEAVKAYEPVLQILTAPEHDE
jgi:multidrug efflux pump subunit AcrA (membrane-fusion protein)